MTYRENQLPLEQERALLVVGLNGSVVGLDRESGGQRWRNDLAGFGTGEVFIAFRYGVLVVSASSGFIGRLDYGTGALLWKRPTTSAGRATMLVEPDLIVVAKGGYIDAFEHDGRPLWKQPLSGMGNGRVALAFPGNVAQADEVGSG